LTVVLCFFLTSLGPYPVADADLVLGLPAPGTMVNLSPAYEPVMIKGLTVHKDNPFLFDFIVDVGQDKMSGQPLKQEGEKLIKYFLASLAIPDKDVWVNLSPYEKNRMIPEALGQTDMGRDLLEQDYILKQITASLIYPEKQLGKLFWDKVYAKAQQMYGTTQVPVNTFNKVWIMADRAEVFEHNQTAFVVDSHLKVMLEEDYLALQKHMPVHNSTDSIGASIVKEIVLPELEKEINTGKNFANLRQIFNSIILASWYKKNLKQALLNQVYANKSKVSGVITSDAKQSREEIYEQYLRAYKKGVFNYIKEDVDASGQAVPRKYFSGGLKVGAAANPAMTTDPATLSVLQDRNLVDFATLASTQERPKADAAMVQEGDLRTKYGDMTVEVPFSNGSKEKVDAWAFLYDIQQLNTVFINSHVAVSIAGKGSSHSVLYYSWPESMKLQDLWPRLLSDQFAIKPDTVDLSVEYKSLVKEELKKGSLTIPKETGIKIYDWLVSKNYLDKNEGEVTRPKPLVEISDDIRNEYSTKAVSDKIIDILTTAQRRIHSKANSAISFKNIFALSTSTRLTKLGQDIAAYFKKLKEEKEVELDRLRNHKRLYSAGTTNVPIKIREEIKNGAEDLHSVLDNYFLNHAELFDLKGIVRKLEWRTAQGTVEADKLKNAAEELKNKKSEYIYEIEEAAFGFAPKFYDSYKTMKEVLPDLPKEAIRLTVTNTDSKTPLILYLFRINGKLFVMKKKVADKAMAVDSNFEKLDPTINVQPSRDAVTYGNNVVRSKWYIEDLSHDIIPLAQEISDLGKEKASELEIVVASAGTGIESEILLEELRARGIKIKKLSLVDIDSKLSRDYMSYAILQLHDKYKDVVHEINFYILKKLENGSYAPISAIDDLRGTADYVLMENAIHVVPPQYRKSTLEGYKKIMKQEGAKLVMGSGSIITGPQENGTVYIDSLFAMVRERVLNEIKNSKSSDYEEVRRIIASSDEVKINEILKTVFPQKPTSEELKNMGNAIGLPMNFDTHITKLEKEDFRVFITGIEGYVNSAILPELGAYLRKIEKGSKEFNDLSEIRDRLVKNAYDKIFDEQGEKSFQVSWVRFVGINNDKTIKNLKEIRLKKNGQFRILIAGESPGRDILVQQAKNEGYQVETIDHSWEAFNKLNDAKVQYSMLLVYQTHGLGLLQGLEHNGKPMLPFAVINDTSDELHTVRSTMKAMNIVGEFGIFNNLDTSDKVSEMFKEIRPVLQPVDTAQVVTKTDKAVLVNDSFVKGGIDLNTTNGMQWKVSKDGNGVEMNIDPAMIERIRREGIDSLMPVVLRMTPIASIWPLVGLQAPVQAEHLAAV